MYHAQPMPPERLRVALVGATLVLSGILPLAAFAAADTQSGSATAATVANSSSTALVPVPGDVGSINPTAVVRGRRVLLRWARQKQSGGRVFYRVWRGRGAGNGLTCQTSPGARWCLVDMPEVVVTGDPAFDDKPGPGRWTYRVAVATNWLDDPAYGDVYYFSRPVTVNVPARR